MNRRGDPLNLIRVMPAKGQDRVTMATSVFLAKLIGPILLVMGLGLRVNARSSRAMAAEFPRSDALFDLSGVLSVTAGRAVVLTCWRSGRCWPLPAIFANHPPSRMGART
jgi:hypothetical protein